MLNSGQRYRNRTNKAEDRCKQIDREYNLARFYSSEQATSRILRAAMNEEPVAQAYVGLLYHHGCAHIDRNEAEAQNYTQRSLEWVRLGMQNRNKYALFLWGCCLAQGRVLNKNTGEAIKCLNLSSHLDLDSASHELALLYLEDNRPGKVRFGRAILEQLAVDTYHPDCQFHHAQAKLNGWFVPRNAPSAFRNFQLAARQGHPGAMHAVGFCHLSGIGTEHSPQLAAEYFRFAAEMGDRGGQAAYAKCCKEGFGVPQSYTTAVEYYRKLAARGDGLALHNLGVAYELGRGVKRNKEEALRHYQAAAAVSHTAVLSSKMSVQRLVNEK